MWQDNTTPEELLIEAQRELALRALLDPEQPGLEPEERVILRHLVDGFDEAGNDSRNYAALAAQLKCDPSTISRKVTRLRERLLHLWRLAAPRRRSPSLQPVAPDAGGRKGERTSRVLEPLVERAIATYRSRSQGEAA